MTDDYQDAADYFISEIERRDNCIKAMWKQMGRNIRAPWDNQSSFKETYPEYEDIIERLTNENTG